MKVKSFIWDVNRKCRDVLGCEQEVLRCEQEVSGCEQEVAVCCGAVSAYILGVSLQNKG